MTEKRFTETLSTGIVTDHLTGKEYKCEMRIDDELLVCLNALNDENEQLKSALKELQEIGDYQAKRIEELNEENRKLEEQLRNLRRLANELYMEGSE